MRADSFADGAAVLRIEGYASVFDVVDIAGDVVRRGAFAASLMRAGPGGVRMLLQHAAEPVGVWDSIVEDARGLYVKGRILDLGARSRAARRLVAARAIDGLSIGFRTVRARGERGRRELIEVDLWEVSIVTFPMLPQARLRAAAARPDATRSALELGA